MNTCDFEAFIGLDWADEKHDFCMMSSRDTALEYGQFSHSPKSVDDWCDTLCKRFKGRSVAIALELNIGPIVSCLQKHAFIKLFHIPPSLLANYRKSFSVSNAKDDPTDAFLQLDYLLKHGDRLREVTLDSEGNRILSLFNRDRRKVADENGDLANAIRARLKCYFPLPLELFSDLETNVFCEFMKKWPDLTSLKVSTANELEEFLISHRSTNKKLNKRRIQLIKQAQHITEDPGIIIPNKKYTLVLIKQLQLGLEMVKQYDKDIAELFNSQTDKNIFESFPAAGPSLAPRLLVAFGSDRTRFQSATEVSTTYGIAPVTKRSGKKEIIQWRWLCPKFERQTFVEWANQTTRHSFWASNYYEKQRAKGKSHQATIRALAFKWIRILYSCWLNKEKYDEVKYLKKLKERGSQYA